MAPFFDKKSRKYAILNYTLKFTLICDKKSGCLENVRSYQLCPPLRRKVATAFFHIRRATRCSTLLLTLVRQELVTPGSTTHGLIKYPFFVLAARCGNPGVPDNGYKDGSVYYYPHILRYGCYAGYTLEGSNTLTCQRDGTWDGTVPTCQGEICFSLII